MPTFVFFPAAEHQRRFDGHHTLLAQGRNAEEARSVAEALIGEPGGLSEFAVVNVSAPVPPFAVMGHSPVGRRGQSVWPTLTRGGDYLRGG